MKKVFALLLTLALLAASFGALAENLGFVTGGTTGTYYAFGGEIAGKVSEYVDGLEITASASGGSKDNIVQISEGEAELGWTQNDVMSYAYQGTEFFDNRKMDSFSAIGAMYPELVQLVVAKDSGITKVEDLKGKNVGVGAIGSGVYFNAVQMLEIAGLTLDDIKPQYLSFAESGESFQNRQVDAFFIVSAYPNASVVEASGKTDVSIITFGEEQMAQLQAKYPYYVTDTIPADGQYNGVDEPVVVPAITAVLIASNSLSEETVYNITKALFEHKDELTNPKKNYITPETAIQGVPTSEADAADGVTGGSFHPGAVKYYKEIGIMK
ncbi:MAG: TAXI family TRAP transporter solute-binding subunit [Clostridia bacterium]|nr:TAXI family TRAP transporter solute-binding subunit [Clostridia bacterium]